VDPEHPGRSITQPRLAALVLARDAEIRFVPIGPVADLQPAVETMRGAGQPQDGRGKRPTEADTSSDSGLAAAQQLRGTLIAPLLSACGPIDTLYVAVDELLELVPLDALPLDANHLVGERVAIRPLVSLFDLLERQGASVGEAPKLLVAGGLDYGRAVEGAAASVDAAASAPLLERSGGSGAWTLLPGTVREAEGIAALFMQAFVEGTAERLVEERAGKAQIAAAAAKATFVHLATHGYFAPETVKSTADATTSRDAFSGEGTVSGLSPLVLCGLALSGANLPPDDLGRHAGILTAEEILSLDLSRCYLVTLSACDTSLGERRAGQGYASLRAALQGAGARYVLTSLWKVGDEATMELMVDFYRRLWVRKQDPHAALWEAKMAARKKGAPFRDWAGWVLTGR
jgi:CHAT domain-containing protein